MNELTLSVPDISCDHCVRAITGEVSQVPGVRAVDVRIATKTVTVTGDRVGGRRPRRHRRGRVRGGVR